MRPEIAPQASFANIAKLIGADYNQGILVSGIAQNASEIEPGDIFLALPGAKHHGIEFLDQAITNGAVAVITDLIGANQKLPTLIIDNPRRVAGDISAYIFGKPSQNMLR
jgi:UDP-N-acetylmuramoyl-L-alanyl-D-glutamate--2,6-diaminopimelate ligase